MGWEKNTESGVLIIKKYSEDELKLTYLEKTQARELPFFEEDKNYYKIT
jgi:hypothetical protein